ncbi:MAG: gamma-glutamylcyclotransferase family protein [Methylococcaceae bacterium]
MTFELLFVYGTLRKHAFKSRHYLLAGQCDYFSDGCLRGKLYEVDDYPGAIESNDREDKIYGELYRLIDDAVLSRLDDYEECSDDFPAPHEYSRKQLPIILPNGDSVLAWAYLYNPDVCNLKRITSGDYLRALERA